MCEQAEVITPDRFYIRCKDCLSIGSIEQRFNPAWSCGICGGNIELMGKVVKDKLEKEEHRAPCDKRCTHAIGPLCVCKCGCVNHGTGRIVVVKIIHDIPVIDFQTDERALEVAEEWRNALGSARELFGALVARRDDWTRPYAERSPLYYKTFQVNKSIRRAEEMRKHVSRMKKLGETKTYELGAS